VEEQSDTPEGSEAGHATQAEISALQQSLSAQIAAILEERGAQNLPEIPASELPDDEPGLAEPAPRPVILRGVEFNPDAHSKWARFNRPVPRLDIDRPPQDLPAPGDETEALLNALIGECHFLMREVAFRSICHSRAAEERVDWVRAAMHLAETGATVAKSVARLRHGPTVQQTHHKVTVQKGSRDPTGGGGPVP
jgi:hypothetical protein